jgi:hypothetical protein
LKGEAKIEWSRSPLKARRSMACGFLDEANTVYAINADSLAMAVVD